MESSDKPNDHVIGTSTGEHPLLIPKVLEHVVKHLSPSFKQLKTLRLVSKTWTAVTLPLWRNSGAVLTFVREPSPFDQDQADYKNGLPVSEFLTEFQDPDSPFQLSAKPFAKYKLKGIGIDFKECSESGGIHNKFWTLIGPLMKSVHFYKCQFTTPRYATGSLRLLVVQMIPNLQHLKLTGTFPPVTGLCPKDQRFYKTDEDDPVEIEEALHLNLRTLTVYESMEHIWGLEEILKVAPLLEVIRGVDQPTSSLIEFLSRIFGIRFYGYSEPLPRPLSNLKHLDLMDSFGDFGMEHHWESRHPPEGAPDGIQLPLETLAIRLEAFLEYPTLSEGLRKFLSSFSSTLKTFKAFRAPVGGKPYFNFLSNCSMGLLTEMDLWGPIAPNFEFLTETPNLKKLRIDLACFEKGDMLDLIKRHNCWNYFQWKYEKFQDDLVLNVRGDLRDGIVCTGLECLEIDFEFPEESLRLLGNWMPNLRTLKTILNKETVPVVCEVWGTLSELVCLHGSKIGNGCFVRGDEEAAGFTGGAGPKLKICDLADLERFQLDANCGEAELTDDVVFNGFLKMTGLKCVEICVSSEMSKEAEEALRKGIPFCKVVRDDQCAGAGLDLSGLRTGERSGCDRCDFRRINEIHGFVEKVSAAVFDEYGGWDPDLDDSDSDPFYPESDNSYDS